MLTVQQARCSGVFEGLNRAYKYTVRLQCLGARCSGFCVCYYWVQLPYSYNMFETVVVCVVRPLFQTPKYLLPDKDFNAVDVICSRFVDLSVFH